VLNGARRLAVGAIRDRQAARLVGAAARRERPLLIFSQPKTGTTTLEVALAAAGLVVPKAHFLQDTHVRNAERHREIGRPDPLHHHVERHAARILDGPRRAAVVTLVRDPVARLLSSLFQSPWLFGLEVGDAEAARRAAIERLRTMAARGSALAWFRKEFGPTFGLSVDDMPFDSRRGWQIYRTERADLLLARTESLDGLSQVLSEFAAVPLRLERRNVRGATASAPAYRTARAGLRLPATALRAIYAEPLMRRFYDPAEIEAFVRRWSD
jgi:hypothetical protein